MQKQLIECVPNFSEGRDLRVIRQITDAIEQTEGLKLISVEPGAATHRTVVTFVGEPEAVVTAAFNAIATAARLIDMRKHQGAHPRFGATDVCPLVPVANISMDEVAHYARQLGERVGRELEIPVYCYEFAAREDKRRHLENCRQGEYEGLRDKLSHPAWRPDYGPSQFTEKVARTGATAIGARNFLVAINFNLNTRSVRRANAVAFDVREKGRLKRQGGTLTGDVLKDADGHDIWEPGVLPKTKAIGWYIDELELAQVSMNINDITVTPVHVAYDAVFEKARRRGLHVTGSEIVGVVPKSVLIEAGRHYLHKQQRSTGVSEKEIMQIAIKSMGLDDLGPFDPHQKVIEYLIADPNPARLVDLSLADFTYQTASESPAPGGGSVSAAMGAMGAALGTMVANLSAHKRGWDHRWKEFSDYAEQGIALQQRLLQLVDEDTHAFNQIKQAFLLPKGTAEEKSTRRAAIQAALQYAIEVPFETMQVALKSMQIIKAMADFGLASSVSDAGVGALAARGAVLGAFMNVKINAADLQDAAYVQNILSQGSAIEAQAIELEREICALVERRIRAT